MPGAVAVSLAAIVACTPYKRGEYVDGSATIYCDEGFQNILEEEINVFEFTYPNASIIPYYVSETEALDSLLANATQAAITTRELTKDEIEFMKKKHRRIVRQQCIAVDAVALITNKENPVTSLDLNDIKLILNGEIKRWNQLAGRDTMAIKLVFDNQGSSTVRYMREKFLPEGRSISDNPNAFAQKTNAEVFDIVKKDPNAIGIISVSWLGDDLEKAKKVPLEQRMESYSTLNDTVSNTLTTEVNILKISNPTEKNNYDLTAYKPYQAYIFTGEYPLTRKVYFISTGDNNTVTHSFYTYITGTIGQKIIALTGIAPYHFNQRVVNVTK